MKYAWTLTDGDPPRLDCDFQPGCKYHSDTKLVLHDVQYLRFNTQMDKESTLSQAVDVHLVCPKCRWWKLFGVAVSEDQWETLVHGTENRETNSVVATH